MWSPNTTSNKRNQGLLKTWQIPGLGKEMSEISLEQFFSPESREAIESILGPRQKNSGTKLKVSWLNMGHLSFTEDKNCNGKIKYI